MSGRSIFAAALMAVAFITVAAFDAAGAISLAESGLTVSTAVGLSLPAYHRDIADRMGHEPRGIVLPPRADANTASLTEVMAKIDTINRTFEEYKATNDEAIEERIKAGVADVITEDKLTRMDTGLSDMQAAIDQANEKIAAMVVSAGNSELNDPDAPPPLSEEQIKFSQDWDVWFRNGGDDNEEAVKAHYAAGGVMAAAQQSVGVDSEGGYTAPVEWDRQITDKRVEVSPMRRYARVRPVTGQGFAHLYNIRGTSAGWVGETDGRPATNASDFARYAFKFGEIYANIPVTQQILEDSEINMANHVSNEANTEFARMEGVAFVSGDGVNKPKGILNFDSVTELALPAAEQHPLGPITEVNTGVAADIDPNGLVDLVYDLPEDRSMGAAFYMNRLTTGRVRKFKDANDLPLWQPSTQLGQPATLLGQPSNELAGLPNIAADAIPVLYGNMDEAYSIFDRRGMVFLRDPYTNKPYVMFYMTKRVGGGLWNPEWMRYHKCAV